MKRYELLRLLFLLCYWATLIAAYLLCGFRGVVLTVLGGTSAALSMLMDELAEETEDKCSTDGLDTERATHKENNQ